MIKYTQKHKKYVDFINTALQNRNIDSDEHDWELSATLHSFISCQASLVLTNSISLGIDSSELLLLIRIKDELPSLDKISNAIATEISKNVENYRKFDVINIIWILNGIDIKIKLRYICSAIVNQVKKGFPYFAKILSTYYVDKDVCTKQIKLSHTKRPEILLLPPLESNIHIQESSNSEKKQYPNDLKGYMLTANLYDIVKIYNQVGDVLFKDNVRFGIGEQLGVDKAIKDTLKTAPEYFWFRNNGITLLIEKPDRILNNAYDIVLKHQNEEKISFSVINGAQTITAAAEYFYKLQAKIEEAKSKGENAEVQLKEEFKNAQNAKVILRIIQIQAGSIPEEARKISVALNRQKPIKMEDIAFTNYFVEKMNIYLEANDIGYSLAKRSEISYSHNEYSLIDFARARKACSGAPGEARNKDAVAMLRISEKTSSQQIQKFVDTKIFVDAWYSSNDNNSDEKIFRQYYSPIPFALKIANLYETYHKDLITKKTYYDTALKNGKWYFVSFLVFVLNGNDTDYSEFRFSAEKLKKEDLLSLIDNFVNYYCELFEEQFPKISSNTFKKSDQYDNMKISDYRSSNFYTSLSQIFSLPPEKKQKNVVSRKSTPPNQSHGREIIFRWKQYHSKSKECG